MEAEEESLRRPLAALAIRAAEPAARAVVRVEAAREHDWTSATENRFY